MTSKIDWFQLKNEYIFGSIDSVADFLKQQGFKLNGNIARRTKGWNIEKAIYKQKLEDKIIEKTIDELSETESQTRIRQALFAKQLQEKARKALDKFEPKNAEEARRMLVDGLKQEREAMGLNRKDLENDFDISSLPIMQTRFGKAIQTMSADELIAVLRRLDELDKIDKEQIENIQT